MNPRMNFHQATFETLKALLAFQSPGEEQPLRAIPVRTDEDARTADQSVPRPEST
jgi:hypothetical protein